jgi:glycosyltransferase involved in cell wall biosynthesis
VADLSPGGSGDSNYQGLVEDLTMECEAGKVSVVIPAYNAGRYIRQTVDSVLAQTYRNVECIVVNDGSTDDTGERLLAYGARIVYVEQENRGRAAARNAGLIRATGEYVALLDADDYWAPDKIEKQLNLFRSNDQLGFVYSWAYRVSEDGKILRELEGGQKPWPGAGQAAFARLITRDDLPVAPLSTLMIRKACLEDIGPFDDTIHSAEEWDLLLRGACRWAISYVPECLTYYRTFGFHIPSKWAPLRFQDVHIEVIERAFARLPSLNSELVELKKLALGKAHILSTHLSVAVGNYSEAQGHLLDALAVCPNLFSGPNCYFVERTAQFASELYDALTPMSDALEFVDALFTHLPAEASDLVKYRKRVEGRLGAILAFDGYSRGDYRAVRAGAVLALRKDLVWAKNVGLWSILCEAVGGKSLADKIRRLYRFVQEPRKVRGQASS